MYQMLSYFYLSVLVSLMPSKLIIPQTFFPFELTNKWQYEDFYWDPVNPIPPTILNTTVTNSITANGQKYFRLSPKLGYYEYLRADSIGIYCYYESLNKEYLLYPFELEIGEYPDGPHITVGPPIYITGNYTDTFKVFKKSDRIEVIFGDSIRVMKYYHYGSILDPAHYDISITKEFGITYFYSAELFGQRFVTILGCLIDSVRYGTLVDVEDENSSISSYALEQNYPNPFNPVTTIRYQIPKAGRVTLKVYDILGKEITTLVNEEKETGRYTVNFDASNLSSGVYLYEIVVNDYRAVKKLITIK